MCSSSLPLRPFFDPSAVTVQLFTINQAKHLLMQPGMPVKKVADRLGFTEQLTFRKYFKSHTGISPTDYRKGKTNSHFLTIITECM